ncbi:hypothetical protein PENSUB_8131 [Penicillium subrubescens]|uniref:Uncharacterized protein n=1 Tax=Penicillium subrubescens TaxID=1316194 RepID=A0A1Q5TI69_9EURO|nr:hypothetical protein PENSUB_8131 [Penicillium subrubescens]
MALESEGLYHATLAIAANTLQLSDSRYRLPALEHHHRALSHLRELLSHDTWGEKELDEMLGLVLMLCWFDVTELAWSKEDDQNDIHPSAVYRLKRNLEDIQQRLPNGQIDPTTECAAIAEANRLGALLLLHETCSPKAASTSRSGLPAFDTEEKSRFVGQILNLILEKKANMMRTAVLPLWPLFLAGCCAREDEERVTVLRLFEELNGIRRFGNIAPAKEVVEMVWRQRDLAAEDEGKRQRGEAQPKKDPLQGARFAWEHAMVMLGDWKLSLT